MRLTSTAAGLLICAPIIFVLLVAAASAAAFVLYGPHAKVAARIEDVGSARFGLVLGTGRLRGDGRISPVFQARMQTAAALFKAGKVEFLILSGYRVGGGRATGDYDEPEDMRGALAALGVPLERLYLDSGSHRTLDSVLRAHCISGDGRVLLISQRDHVARALFLAWANGMEAVGVAAAEPPEGDRIHEIFASLRAVFDIAAGSGLPCDGLRGNAMRRLRSTSDRAVSSARLFSTCTFPLMR